MGSLRSIPLRWVKRGNHALAGLVVALGAVSSIANGRRVTLRSRCATALKITGAAALKTST
jgi:hypothetical protein